MDRSISPQTPPEVVGLVPAAGWGRRVAPLPCSKEIYPVGFHTGGKQKGRPRVAMHYLLENMRRADVQKVYVVLREGKWDIPAYLGDGHELGLHVAYLMMRLPHGTPFTLDQAHPFVQDARVVFGFPDILFQADDAFVRLLEKQRRTGADVVLGLFPAHQPHKMDMVEADAEGRVRSIIIKPAKTLLKRTWIIAVWTPAFTAFMHTYLKHALGEQPPEAPFTEAEVFVGDVIQAAIDSDLHVASVAFPEGSYVDIGTPRDLRRAVRDAPLGTAAK